MYKVKFLGNANQIYKHLKLPCWFSFDWRGWLYWWRLWSCHGRWLDGSLWKHPVKRDSIGITLSGLGVGPGAFPPRLVVNALTVGIVRNIGLVSAIVISFALCWGFRRMKIKMRNGHCILTQNRRKNWRAFILCQWARNVIRQKSDNEYPMSCVVSCWNSSYSDVKKTKGCSSLSKDRQEKPA